MNKVDFCFWVKYLDVLLNKDCKCLGNLSKLFVIDLYLGFDCIIFIGCNVVIVVCFLNLIGLFKIFVIENCIFFELIKVFVINRFFFCRNWNGLIILFIDVFLIFIV